MDPDTAVKKLEYANYYLSECGEEEKQAVLDIIAEMRHDAVKIGNRALIDSLDQIPLDAWHKVYSDRIRLTVGTFWRGCDYQAAEGSASGF